MAFKLPFNIADCAVTEELKQAYNIELQNGETVTGLANSIKAKVKAAQEYMGPLIEHFNTVHNGNKYITVEDNQ